MCIVIIWNNSLVGGCTPGLRFEVWTQAVEHVTLYCTWRQGALTTGLHGQVEYILKMFIHFCGSIPRSRSLNCSTMPNFVEIACTAIAISKKIVISQPRFKRFWRFDRCIVRPSWSFRPIKIKNQRLWWLPS